MGTCYVGACPDCNRQRKASIMKKGNSMDNPHVGSKTIRRV